MVYPSEILRPTDAGLYCPPGDFYVDPTRAVERAVITHGHGDHARAGHGHVLATAETLAIMAERYGADFAGSVQTAALGETVTQNGVDISLHPAGHVLGSAQAAICHKGCTLVVSGDYKRRPDATCTPFEPVPCDVFITEATFGLPVFRHPDDASEVAKLLQSLKTFPDRPHLVGAYALGKAQRVLTLIRNAGYDAPIYYHGAVAKLNALYERHGIDLGTLVPVAAVDPAQLNGQIIIAPPSALADRWSRRTENPVTAFASGWMRVRARARQRGVSLPMIISDHADWDELTTTIDELHPEEVWVTHGREDALVHWAHSNGMNAQPLSIVGYDDDADD